MLKERAGNDCVPSFPYLLGADTRAVHTFKSVDLLYNTFSFFFSPVQTAQTRAQCTLPTTWYPLCHAARDLCLRASRWPATKHEVGLIRVWLCRVWWSATKHEVGLIRVCGDLQQSAVGLIRVWSCRVWWSATEYGGAEFGDLQQSTRLV
jgi:hypothetical protein